jgi:hypothetical protein
MVLRREGNVFYDLMQQRSVTLEEIRSTQHESLAKYAAQFSFHSSLVLIEEAILDVDDPDFVPPYYMVWTFNGRTAFIEQVDRNTKPKSAAWYVEDFQRVEVDDVAFHELKVFQRGRHRPPRCAQDILRVARAASRALRTPYIRVDTYATPSGAMIGELTTGAGPLYHGAWRFQPWFDELLGAQWSRAIKELQESTPAVATAGSAESR